MYVIGQEFNHHQLVLRPYEVGVVLVHLHYRLDDLSIADHTYLVFVLAYCVQVGKDVVQLVLSLLVCKPVELLIYLYELDEFLAATVDDGVLDFRVLEVLVLDFEPGGH